MNNATISDQSSGGMDRGQARGDVDVFGADAEEAVAQDHPDCLNGGVEGAKKVDVVSEDEEVEEGSYFLLVRKGGGNDGFCEHVFGGDLECFDSAMLQDDFLLGPFLVLAVESCVKIGRVVTKESPWEVVGFLFFADNNCSSWALS